MRLILATENAGKIKEFSEMLAPLGFEVMSMRDVGFTEEIVEDKTSYEGNALIKARAVHQAFPELVIADDSGLSIDCLDGYPGIYSARFAGKDTSYTDKITALWELLKDREEPYTAAYHCAIALILPDGREEIFVASVPGIVITERRGTAGFGYDPIFYYPPLEKTCAEMSPEEKNSISHRALALKQCLEFLQKAEKI